MAERGSREGSTRRQSLRRSLAEAGLPDDYLDALEQKRKQLDESIHKYIAAKERDYKQYERELRTKYSIVCDREREGGKTRRTSSESTQEPADSPRLLGQQQHAIDLLLSAGLKKEQIGQPVAVALWEDGDGVSSLLETKAVAGLTDRRASVDRNKEFVGVFTPTFLPALEDEGQQIRERTTSAPTAGTPTELVEAEHEKGVHRANSDSVADGKHKRPAHLQLVQRTSSSGSSVDGKLTSALKSPSQRPKRKRVSLAVGDTIVAPSDSVPISLDHHSTPSHSRTRSSPALDGETKSSTAIESLRGVQRQPLVSGLSSQLTQSAPNGTITMPERTANERRASPPKVQSIEENPAGKSASPPITPTETRNRSPPKVDPDGDLFDLEEEDDSHAISFDVVESEDEVVGRVEVHSEGGEYYDRNAGLLPEPSPPNDHAEHVEFVPGSANASQQPTNPGFRRPSVTFDPIYLGDNYDKAEQDAVVNDVYGSSYVRPSKGSFTAGSLGESFMARNAELLRNRSLQESVRVPS